MKRELLITADGSHTVAIPQLNLTYHSTFGAIQESEHVFINAGLRYVLSHYSFTEHRPLCLFEMGFGTGLSALLTYRETLKENIPVYYRTVELFPLSEEEAMALNYVQQAGNESLSSLFALLHTSEWNQDVCVAPGFILHKDNCSLSEVNPTQLFHLVYFDAFAPAAQPELWTRGVFEKLYCMLYKGGALVTYCSKGEVRRALQSAGFRVEKLKGPPGKREMVRALK